MKTIILLIAIQVASDKPITLEPHPACSAEAVMGYSLKEKIICVDSERAFRDFIFSSGFE